MEVIDSNEFRPQFLQPHYSAVAGEGSAPGTALVRVEAEDGDGTGQLVYTVLHTRSPASLELFHLHHLTGELTVARPLDR